MDSQEEQEESSDMMLIAYIGHDVCHSTWKNITWTINKQKHMILISSCL